MVIIAGCHFCNHSFSTPSDAPEALVSDLVTNLQQEAQKDVPDFENILTDYFFDWESIAKQVSSTALRMARTNPDLKQKYDAFLKEFIPIFKTFIVKKYSSAELLNQFKSAQFGDQNISKEGKCTYIESIATIPSENGGTQNWQVKWKIANKNNKIIEIEVAGVRIFNTQMAQATEIFNNAYNLKGSYDAGLEALKTTFKTIA